MQSSLFGLISFWLQVANDFSFSKQILYTGDFSRQEDRHLMAAEIPNVRPDVLIVVSILLHDLLSVQLLLHNIDL